jgi:enoyl-CoA hydratase/carnithine racemase
LDIISQKHEPGVVITTSGIEKFYTNGLDLDHVRETPHYFKDSLYKLYYRFLTYPMPTVALVNGHAFAGGLMLAMMQDYRIMNPHKGYVCLIGLELGYGLRPPMLSIFREKVSAATLRKMILEAYRFKVRFVHFPGSLHLPPLPLLTPDPGS